jgi:hypothetical protein
MADAQERAKYLADEKAIRDKWYRENPRPVKQTEKPKAQQAQQPINMTGLTTPPVDSKFVLPTQEKVKVPENLPKPTPYMAMGVDKYGQGLYGEGLKGWARKAWADLTDPMKYFQDQKKLSQAAQDKIKAEYETGRKKAGAVVEDKLQWSKWGEKMFGITSEELGSLAPLGKAERDIAEQAGQSQLGTAVSRTARIALDTTQNVVWGGLAILGLGDEAMRKAHSARVGLDAVADRFNKDEDADSFVGKLISANPVSVVKDIYTVASAINEGKLKWSDTKETISEYQAGSDMVYSMVFEEGAKAEFEKGLAEGRDPYVMAQDMGSIGIELAGSILGDPTTYLGLSLVRPVNIFSLAGRESGNVVNLLGKTFRVPWKTIARIPEFGELIGAGVGKARFAAEARFITDASSPIAKVLEKANYAAGDMDAAKVGREAVQAIVAHFSSDAVNTLDKAVIGKGANMVTPIKALPKLKVWNMLALDTDSKINVIARDTKFFLQRLIANSNGLDESMLVLQDMVAVRKGGVKAEEAAARLISKGSEVFSPVGEMVGDILSKLDDEKISDFIVKHADDRTELHTQLFKKLGSIVQDYVPSVDEMFAATEKIKEFKVTGKVADEKTIRFAEMYKDVPYAVKKITQITKGPRAVSGATSSAMVRMYMQFVPRSWSRNIQGAFIPMASRIGFANALETALSATIPALSKGGTSSVLQKVDDSLLNMLDFVPSEEGIAKMVSEGKGIFRYGMLGAIRRSEEIMGRKIIEKASRDHIQKALPAVVKDLPEWKALTDAMPKESQGLMFAALERADGNVDKADKIVRKWIGTGEIPAWQLIEPSPDLDDYLRTHDMWDLFTDARDNAKSSDEFVAAIKTILDNEKAEVKHLYNSQEILSDAFVKMDDFGIQLAESTEKEQREAIVGLYQSWHNTQKALKDAVGAITSNVDRKVAAIVDPAERMAKFEELQVLKNGISQFDEFTENAWETVDNVRRPFVRQLKAAKTDEDYIQLFNQVFEGGNGVKFKLADIYKGADPRNFDTDASKRLAWSAFFEFASDTHKTANVQKYEGTMAKFNEIAELFDSNLDKLAEGNQSGENVFNVLQTHYADAQKFQEQHAWERFFRQREFIKDTDETLDLASEVKAYADAHPTWDGDLEKFTAQINNRNTQSTNISLLANKYGIPTATKDGTPLDKKLLAIINDSLKSGVVEEVSGKTVKTKDAFRYISKNGGMNPAVFKEIMGDTIGKQRMIPGLTNKKAKGIDELGIKLWEGGFISKEEADDAAFVTDFLRNFQKKAISSDERLAADEAEQLIQKGYSSLADVPPARAEAAFKAHAEKNGLTAPKVATATQPALIGNVSLAERIAESVNLPIDQVGKLDSEIEAVLKANNIPDDVIRALQTERRYKVDLAKTKTAKAKSQTSANASRALDSAIASSKGQGFVVSDLLKKNGLTRDKIKDILSKTDANVSAEKVVDLADTGNQSYFDEAGNLVDPVAEKKALTLKEAKEAFKQMKVGRPEHSQLPTDVDIRHHALKGFEQDTKKWMDAVVKEWGVTTKTTQIPNFDELMGNMKRAIKPRLDHVKLEAAVTGVSTRNFVLHDYNKTYMDHAMTMLLGNSFHYWTTRTYARSLENLIQNPKYANMYMKYKEYNVKRHSDQPDWYRQNIQINSLFGIDLKNPYFMNLEAAINPMYGLTGVDFNDPRKRVDWMSRTVDDMNKMGPTFSPLVSWGIGLAMFNKGEQEAGERWFGRMLPQTGLVKEATSKFLGKPIELDPFVKFLEGGVDPYERNRVSAALANMVRTGQITQEQMIEAARTKEGDIWEAGIEASATARFGSTATSFFFGAGLKPRTEEDMKIEKFWQDYSAMIGSSSMMTPEQYRQSWDKMRDNEEYGMYMDALLLSRKSGNAMDSAYAYNVFGRVPPGELNAILETVGIRPDLVQAFYDNKGDFSKMNLQPQDRERFMAGAIDIGAILAMPDAPTREDWGDAKDQYKQMNNVLVEQFGEGILELMSDYYNDPNPSVFLDDNPDVKAAMQMKDAIVTNNPKLMQYYGGINTMERYYNAMMERDLAKVYGANIRDVEAIYYDLLTTEEQKAYKKQHPELAKYWDDKKVYKDKLDRRIVVFGSNLPPRPTPQLRPDKPQNPNVPQAALQNLTQPQRSWQDWQQELGGPMTDLIKEYWAGEKLPYPVKSKLDFEAEKYGYYDSDEFLQAILMSLQ